MMHTIASGPRAIASRADSLNLAAAGIAAAAAHCAPYLTLLVAYAALGPAHYLTEISWLHQRRYFASGGIWVGASLAALATGFIVGGAGPLACAALAGALALSATAALGASGLLMAGVTLAAIAMALALGAAGFRPLLIAVILVPTAVHVLAFTIGFVVRGARRTKSPGGWLVVAAIATAVGSFVLVPPTAGPHPGAARLVADLFGSTLALLGGDHLWLSAQGAAGLLAFGYTYHYLNWFSKTAAVGWHRQGADRLALIGIASLAIGAAYLVNFRLGFLLSLPLSVAHVFLEFPLNAATFGLSRRVLTMPVVAAPRAAAPVP